MRHSLEQYECGKILDEDILQVFNDNDIPLDTDPDINKITPDLDEYGNHNLYVIIKIIHGQVGTNTTLEGIYYSETKAHLICAALEEVYRTRVKFFPDTVEGCVVEYSCVELKLKQKIK